jgi:hypothetical protein
MTNVEIKEKKASGGCLFVERCQQAQSLPVGV